MNIRPYLIFAACVYGISAIKTICLAADLPETDFSTQYVLSRDGKGVRSVSTVIEGTDVPMPFTKPVEVTTRTVGFSKLVYAVYPGTSLRDTRYPTFWR